jgi:hypothetical protein
MDAAQATSTETQTQTTSTADAAQTSAPAVTTDTAQTTDQTAAAAPPAWTPDFKFKAAGAEHEIPEMFRGLAKDQKSLEEVKRLHEKAYGLDSLAQNRDSLKKQLADYEPRLKEYETVSASIKKLSHFVEHGDFDSFFQGIGIKDKDVIKWVQQKIELHNASPEVRAQHEQNRQLMQKQYDNEQKLAQYEAQQAEYSQAEAFNQVSTAITESAKDFADYYDEKMGQQGAFTDLVINKGIQITEALGREPALNVVIDLVKSELTKLGVQPQASFQGGNPQAAQQIAQQKQNKPTIPVISAGGQSPVASPIKSMKDLEAKIAAMG